MFSVQIALICTGERLALSRVMKGLLTLMPKVYTGVCKVQSDRVILAICTSVKQAEVILVTLLLFVVFVLFGREI